jgi:hypothetical protein
MRLHATEPNKRLELRRNCILEDIHKICLKVILQYFILVVSNLHTNTHINILITNFQRFQNFVTVTSFVYVLCDVHYKCEFHFTLKSSVTHGAQILFTL